MTTAGSYQGDILGAILAQLILHTAVQERMGLYPIILEDCDNLGVVRHGNKPRHQLSMTQTHSDILQALKRYIIHQPFALKFLYVASEVQSKMIIMGHQILSCHDSVVRSFSIL
jgi:hypothetical protein